jgi:hypothetical protein
MAHPMTAAVRAILPPDWDFVLKDILNLSLYLNLHGERPRHGGGHDRQSGFLPPTDGPDRFPVALRSSADVERFREANLDRENPRAGVPSTGARYAERCRVALWRKPVRATTMVFASCYTARTGAGNSRCFGT